MQWLFYNMYSTHQNICTMCTKNLNVCVFSLATIFISLQSKFDKKFCGDLLPWYTRLKTVCVLLIFNAYMVQTSLNLQCVQTNSVYIYSTQTYLQHWEPQQTSMQYMQKNYEGLSKTTCTPKISQSPLTRRKLCSKNPSIKTSRDTTGIQFFSLD